MKLNKLKEANRLNCEIENLEYLCQICAKSPGIKLITEYNVEQDIETFLPSRMQKEVLSLINKMLKSDLVEYKQKFQDLK